jgi:hypothetical protein
MATSLTSEFKNKIGIKASRFFTLLSFVLLSLNDVLGQAPTWVAGTPSIPSTGALSITCNYGINMTGTVYIIVYNYHSLFPYTGSDVKVEALAGPSGPRVATYILPITAGNVGLTLQVIMNVINANTDHTIYIAAESSGGIIQALGIRLYATTLPCTKIDILTGFTQPVVCINKGTIATFQTVILNPDPNANGIFKGTQWTLDWGDGNTAAYTSVADDDLPPIALRTHTYSNVTACNYVFSNGIKNPCGETRAVQYIAVVHGRDIPSDGDGILQIVDNATGSAIIQVCAGNQTTITLRDNSTWNCQNPVLPGGLTPVPNTDPRNIEWTYGEDPTGAITNTITGAVSIAALGNAPVASGRLSPIAAPGTLSQAITIPATCQAGQYFRVWLKNWNKCNWTDPEYVDTFVDILVIASPPAPTVPNSTICRGGVRTLSVTSVPVGTISWYSDITLTTLVGTGLTYTQPQLGPGVYNYWVVDKSLVGLLCQGPATQTTLTIHDIIANNTIAAVQTICSGTAPAALTGTLPTGGNGTFAYLWQSSTTGAGGPWAAASGTNNTQNYTPPVLAQSTWYRRTVISGPCNDISNVIQITVNPLPQGSLTSNGPFCVTGAGMLTWTATAGTGPYIVVYTENGGPNRTQAGVTSGTAFATFTTPVVTTTTYALVSVTDANGCVRNAVFTGGSTIITVNSLPQGSLTSNGPFCATGAGMLTWTATSGTGPYTVVYTENGGPNRTQAGVTSGTAFATFTTPVVTTTTYALVSVTDANGCVRNAGFTGGSTIITVRPLPQGSLTSNGPFCATGAGMLTWTATSGTGPYTVVYTENGGPNRTQAGVTSGTAFATFTTPVVTTTTYALVSVTDANGCVRNAVFTSGSTIITVNSLPQGSLTSNGPFCATGAGMLTWTATSGTGPYTVVYTENGGPNRTQAGVTSGTAFATFTTPVVTTTTYALVSVTDANGCVRNAVFTGGSTIITVNSLPQGSLTSNGPFCATGAGMLTWTATSGTGPYTVVYTENGGPNRTQAGVTSGTAFATFTTPVVTTTTYALVSVTDANGCVRNAGFTGGSTIITVRPLPQGSLTSNGPFCATGAGMLTWTATAGTGPYTVVYTENGGPNRTQAGVTSGTAFATFTTPVVTTTTYALVSVTDANGCVRNAGFTGGSTIITVNSLPQGSLTSNGPFCATGAGMLTWTATSGTGPYIVVYTENGGPNRTQAGVTSGTAFATFTTPVVTTTTYALVSVTDANGCVRNAGFTGGSATITIFPAATVNAGPDQSICALGTATLAGSFGGGATSAIWSGGTGAYAPNNTTMNAVYTPSAAEKLAGTVTLILTTDDPAGPCPAVSDNVIITIGAPLTGATLTGSGSACSGATSTIKSVITGGAGPYTINYTRNGVAQPAMTPYVSGTDNSLGVLPVGVYNYQITSVTDPCGNSVPPAGLPPVYTITIYANPVANAGVDLGICGALVTPLAAVPSVGIGTWTETSGPGTVVFSNPNSATSNATVSLYGTYIFRWTEVNGGLCTSFDEVTVTYAEAASAGPAQNLCSTLAATLAGNTPSVGTGTWTLVSGPGTVAFTPTANTPGALATVSAYGSYVFKWTINNGAFCTTNQNVAITYEVAASAGPAQNLCSTLAATLAGNTPAVGTGTWTLVSGPGTVAFTPTANTPGALATVSAYGSYVFKWTINNGAFCTTNQNVAITYEVAASAGPAQNLCSTLAATLAGNTPAVGTGTWTLVSGPGTVAFTPTANTPGALATVSTYGSYVFKWTINNGAFCTTNQNVAITYEVAASAGPAQNLCSTLAATLAGNTPAVGTGTWTLVSGPGTVAFTPTANTPGALATVSAYGSYVFKWTINNGAFCTTNQNVAITYEVAASAGPVQNLCSTLAATLAGNTPAVGTGTWTLVSGPGTVAFTPTANTPGALATVSTYGSYVFKWTINNGAFCTTNQNVAITYEVAASAGPAQNLCSTLAATLAGNTPAVGTGTWTLVSGPGTVAFTPTANTPGALATVSAYGSYVFKWTINNGAFCTTNQNVAITYEVAASAGPAQNLCSTLAATLAGNTPAVGTGTWTLVSGPGTVAFTPTANTPGALATVSAYGSYVFKWTINNGAFCTTNQNVAITYEVAASAGPAQNLCSTLAATLAGNTPAVGTGTWTLVSGPGTVAFTPTANTPGALATVSTYGSYVFKWTINNGAFCTTNQNVAITYEVAASAGPAQNLCSTLAATLAGNTPAVGTGTWTLVSGPGTVAFTPTANTPGALATVSTYGSYVFKWTINNGAFCTTNQNVAITYEVAASAGPAQNLCSTLAATLAGNTPAVGTGTWTLVSGPGTVAFTPTANTPGALATVSAYGSYVFKWTINNGAFCTTNQNVAITYEVAASAGPAQNLCSTLAATLAGNTPAVGTGTWTLVSGPGTVAFTPTVNTPGALATVSTYGSYVFKWTINNGAFCTTNQNVAITYEVAASAGPAQNLCSTLAATLAGNTPAVGTGTWTLVSGPGTVAFTPTANTPGALATVSTYGSYVFKWTINNGAFCTTNQNVAITYEVTASAGPAQNLCSTLAATLAGNTPAVGTGTWTLVSGPGTVAFTPTANTPGALATVSAYGSYVFKWTINNGAFCTTNQNVAITYEVAASAGPAQNLCSTLAATLAGNTPAVGTGTWTLVSGPGTVAFTPTANTPGALATVSTYGSYVFKWTINNGAFCTTNQNVAITYEVAASAGPAQNLCSTLAATLAGNTPALGTGTWTLVSGPGTVAFTPTANTPGALATVSTYGSYVFKWTINNGAFCTTNQNVAITYEVAASAGPAQNLCSTLAATLAGNTPAVGTGTWTLVSGPGTVAFTPTANTPGALATVSAYGSYVFKWTINNGAFCTTNQNVTINYNPAGQVDQPANQIVCNGTTTTLVNFTTANIIGSTTYSWTNSVPGIGLAAAGTGNIAPFTATNGGTIPVVATIIVTPTLSNGPANCVGPTKTFTITVNPTPVLSTTLTPADVCSNTLFSYPPASATAGTTFNWTRAAVVGITPAGPTAGANDPAETLRNITSVPIAVTYQFTLAANGCTNVQNVIVNIKPEPVITPGQNPGACSGNALSYQILLNNFVNFGDNVTFTWGIPVLNPVNPSFSGGTARAVPSSVNITDTFINTMGVTGTATYSVTPFKNGCSGTPVDVVVTVGSQPVLDPGLNAFACSNSPIGLVLKEAPGSVVPTYYYIFSKNVSLGLTEVGNAAVPDLTAPANYLAADKYINTTGFDKTVTYRVQPILAPTCIGAFVDIVITIHPQPVIFPAQSKTVCSRVAIGKEILLAPPNVPAGSLFNWAVPAISDGSIQGTAGVNVVADPAGTVHINDQIHNYSAAPITATYQVTPVSQFSCAGTQEPVIITINPEPVPQPISGRDKICVTDKNIVYNVTAVGGSTFHWTVDPAVGTKTFDFNTNAILINAAAVAGSGNITVYETNSFICSGDISTLPVQVYTQPAPENIIGNAVVCANSTQVYNVTNRVGSIYSWTVPGGASIMGDPSASSITVIFANVGGTISVRETNAAGCITNHTPKAITVNPLPTATISGGAMICDGASRNLSVAFTGTGPYTFTYALNGVPQAPVATAANPYTLNVTAAGTYTIVNVTDANCTNNGSGTTTVTFFPKPTGTISGTMEMCRGGSATLTMSFTGVPPYTFTYTDGITPVTVVGNLTNVYTVAVSPLVNTTYTLTSLTDGNSCTGVVSGSAVITVNIPPALTLTGTNLICYNVSTGAVNMAIANGTAPFGFSWTGPSGFTANIQNISALASGYYAVVVTDSKGCTGTANITLTQPAVLNGSAAGTNITCFGANDGTITVSGATGGAGTYEFSRNGGTTWQASPNFNALAPGTYNVIMRDAVNPTCMLTLNGALQLTEPAILNGVVTKTDVNCFGANNGSIVISAPAGGYGTYGYSIDGGGTWQGSGNFTNLAPAIYDVRIRDAVQTACFVILSPAVTVAQPVALSAIVNSTNVTCFGLTNGTITISAPAGGHGTFEYSINGGGSWQATGNYTALAPGTYNVQIRDASFTGCFKVLNAALVISQPAVLQANVASTNVTCNGAADGIINITAPTGGYGTYEYSISGGTLWQASGLFNALAPATYDVRIRDAANPLCFIILNAGLQITQPAALSGTVVSTNVSCFGANDGQIQVTNSAGGYGTYEYSDNGGTAWQASGNFTNLVPASYNVMMRDKAHTACVLTLNNALLITQPPVLSATVNNTNVTCFGANDGTITISNPLGGYGSYSYSVNGGTSWQGSGTFTNLAPASYNVKIRDAVNTSCVITLNAALLITEPPVLSAAVAKTNVTCNGAADGTITINGAAGGYGTYEYTVNGGTSWQASPVFSALIPGFYNVKIRDAANTGCVVTLNGSLNVTEPAALSASVAKTNVTCNGAANGTITISSPSGGYGTYEYSINGGTSWQVSGVYINLAPASYDVRIRDAAHTACVIILNPALVITQPGVLTATVTPAMVSCNGASDGIIAITGVAGGYGTYEYSANGGTTWSGLGNFTNLAPATYDVRIRDAANPACVIILNPGLIITQPPVLSATVAKTDISCFGASNGTISISAPAGGYGTYEYSINGGGSWQASGNFTLLGPGNYNVQIRDAAHISCVVVLNNAVQITQPPVLNAVVTPTNVSCNGANNGIINITAPTGGYGTYEYSDNGGTTWQASGLFNALVPATYDVRIRDAAHTACTVTLNSSLVITEPAILSASVTGTNVTCNGAGDGTISVTNPTGGYGTYEYSDNGGTTWQASGNFISLVPASYNVQIRDKAHTACVIVLNAALVITQPAVLSATVASTNASCAGANNGIITITNPLGGNGTYAYSVNGGASWQASGSFTNLAPGSYNVRIRDAANTTCVIILNPALSITEPPVLAATVASTNVTCSGTADGSITISASSGGYGTYEYSINGGTGWQASPVFPALIPGFYNVQIRDAAHTACVVILNGSLQITQPAALSANVVKTNVTCNGANDGSITVSSPSGGYGTYEYSNNGGTSWQASGNFINLAPATYDVRIRDAAHPACVTTLNAALVITAPAVITATVTPTMITCNGSNDGIISVTAAAGGYGTYQYSDNGGTSWQGSGTFTNLAPSNYDVRIRDAANTGCVITLNPALAVTQPPVLSASLARSNVTCFGGNDGTVTISAPSGGYGTYEYSINGGGSWQASGNFTLLSPGSYNVLIRDAAHTGCVVVLNNSYAISQPLQLSATVAKTDVTCQGANDGTITVSSPAGGYGTYQYSINGGTTWGASGTFTSLVPATYDVRMRDAVNTSCSVILYPNLVISEPVLLALTSTGDIVLHCNGDMDGTGTFYASGGSMPYTFHVILNTTGGTLAAPGFNSQTFFNAGAGVITIAVTDFKGCFAQATINVTQPALLTPGTISADQVLCAGDNPAQLIETVPAAGGPGAYSYQWQYGTSAAGPFINIAGATATIYTPAAGANSTLYYRRMVTSGICMPVYSNVVEILVNPKPVAILSGGETICPAQNSILKVNMMVGTGPFELDIDNLGTITGYVSGADITVTPAVTTTYKLLRVRDANGCQVLSPSANLLGSATVTVRSLPAITTSPVNKTICEYGMAAFNVVATGTDITYQWYVNTGSGFNPVVDGGVYFGATNPTLSLFGATRTMSGYVYHVVVTGCSSSVNSADATLTVNTAPEFTAQPKDTTACMNAGAAFNVTANGTAVNYQWQVNKGAGFINVVDDANFSGSNLNTLTITNAQAAFNNYIFRAILTGTCGIPTYSNFAVLRVNIPPSITLNPVNKAACDGTGPIVFNANGSGIIDSLRWQVFSGGVWSDIYDNAVYSGTQSQQLTLVTVPLALNGNQYRLAFMAKCTTVNTTAATLTVNPNPVVNFSAIDPVHACGNVPLVINGNPSGGSGIWSSHLWTGDIGPLNNYFIQSPVFSSQIAGSYALNYKVKDSKGCYGNGDVTVIVDAPDASFTQDRPNGCTPATVTFTKDMTGIAKFWWDFGDGSPKDSVDANPVHTFTNSVPSSIDYYNVTLTVRSPGGCLDSFTSTVTVFPAIDATFTATPSVVCSGKNVILTAQPGASRYFWNFGDGVSGYFPNSTNHLYTNFTTAAVNDTITLTTTSFYNCTDVKKLVVKVMPVPLPQFTALPVTQIYNTAGNPVAFTNTTNPGAWTWSWHFGDGTVSTDQNPTHTYTVLGTFDVVLSVTNGSCSDSVEHTVSVTPIPPVANFDFIPSGCAPLSITLNNTSLFTDTPGTTYSWDFGDGAGSTAKNPTYTYFDPGTFRVELTVTGPGGVSSYSQVVSSYPSPKANFEVTPTVVFVNDEKVRCFNLSQGADSYLWNFGDGDTSKVQQPFHKYMAEGVYDITLWAYVHNVINGDTVVCSDKYVLSPAVTVEPAGSLRFSTVFTPNISGENEIDHLPTGAEIDKYFFPPVNQKVVEYKLQIFNRLGVLIFESHDINKPWDGYYHHKLCQQGVYVWYVEGKYANGQPFKKVGDVTLLH